MVERNQKFEISVEFNFVEENDWIWYSLSTAGFDLALNWSDKRLTGTAIVSAPSQELAFNLFQITAALAGLRILKVDLGLVSISDIAEELDVSRETVRLWTEGKRRSNFPVPFAQVGGSNIWTWSDVYEWASKYQKNSLPKYKPLSAAFAQSINGNLANDPINDYSAYSLIRSLGYNPSGLTQWPWNPKKLSESKSWSNSEQNRFVS